MSGGHPEARIDADLLRRTHERARAAWPSVVLDPETFGRHLAARVPDGSPDAIAALHALHTDDLYLACACAAGDAAALAAFDEAHLAPICGQLARRYPIPGFADELRQVVRERLLVTQNAPPRIASYSGRGPLSSWVRITATREAVDLRKKLAPGGDELLPEHAVASADPELDFLRRQYGTVVRAAIAASLEALDANEATALRLFYLEGVRMKSIASVLRTSERSAQRMLATARERILEETRRRLRDGLGGSPTQMESLIRLVRADLGASVVAVLKKEE